MLNLALIIGATLAAPDFDGLPDLSSIDMPDLPPAATVNANESAQGPPHAEDADLPPPGIDHALTTPAADMEISGEVLSSLASEGRRKKSRPEPECDDILDIANDLKKSIFDDTDCECFDFPDTKTEKRRSSRRSSSSESECEAPESSSSESECSLPSSSSEEECEVPEPVCEEPAKRKGRRPYKSVRPESVADATAMTIA